MKSEKVQIERKTFVFTLKENPRGRFLRITEDVGGRRDTIIIPSTGLEDFKKLLDEMLKVSGELPVFPVIFLNHKDARGRTVKWVQVGADSFCLPATAFLRFGRAFIRHRFAGQLHGNGERRQPGQKGTGQPVRL